MLDALALGGEAALAIEPVHGAVEGLMRAPQVGRHEVGVVEVGQRRVGMGRAGVEHGLRQGFQLREVGVSGGIGKVL